MIWERVECDSGIPVERGSRIIVLGSPVGDQAFIEEMVARWIKKSEELKEKLEDLEDHSIDAFTASVFGTWPLIIELMGIQIRGRHLDVQAV